MSASNPLWTSIKYNPVTGCWNWTGYCNPKGYGTKWYMGRKEMVHRKSEDTEEKCSTGETSVKGFYSGVLQHVH